jgi:hypothetical protein
MDRPLFPARARTTPLSLRLRVLQILAGIRAWHVFVVAFALRLPVVWLQPPPIHTENINAGFTLAQRGYFGDPFAIPTGPTAHLSPAYPLVVAAVRSITPSDDACMHVLSIILAVVTSCNIAALLPLSRALKLPRESGTIAALMWLIPFFTWVELSGQHETPLTVAALLALVTLVARITASARPTMVTGAKLGLAAGVAAYVTPLVLPVTAFATIVGARLVRWKTQSLLAVLAGATLAFAAAILPYTLRNHHLFGAWFFMRDNFGLELAMSNGPNARAIMEENMEARAGGAFIHHPFISRAAAAEMRDVGEVEYDRRLGTAAVTWIRANPVAFLKLVIQRAGYMVLPQSKRWYQGVIAGAISLMAIAGAVLLWSSRYRFGIRCLSAAILGYLLIYLLIEHSMRYIYPALFLESLIAASFLLVLARWNDPAPPQSEWDGNTQPLS